MSTNYDIKNKTVLVTGANRGIGKAIVESFLEKGAKKLYLGVRDLTSAEPLVEKYGEQVETVQIDMQNPASITAAAQIASDVDVVVSNAGILKNATPLDDNAIDAFNQEMEVNVGGLIRMAQAFAPILKENGGGAFIQLNSIASIKNFLPFTTYSASKAAAYSVTQGLRDLLSEQGTVVVSVHPGPIATDMANSAGFTEIAEPASLVADSIIDALNTGTFHAFPDTMAKQIEQAYQSYATNIIEVNLMEA